jgi:hypothetical protein
MRTIRAILIVTLLTIPVAVANAQSGGLFSTLPPEAQAGISNTLLREVPGLSLPQLAKLTSSDGQLGDGFGFSIAISGNTIVVGLSESQLGTHNAAWVFVKPPSGWTDMTQTAELTPSDSPFGFGYAVGISGTTVVVAAPGSAAAYVYVMPTGGWHNTTETAKLTPTGGGIYELAVSGDTVVVSSAFNNGSSFVFVKPTTGWVSTSTPNATLITPFFGNFCQFCVGVSGDTIAVGTPGSFSGEGAVYVFVKPTGGWLGVLNPTATLVASDGLFNAQLGISVAVSGNTVVGGANGYNQNRGALYVFEKPVGGWKDTTETARLTALDSLDLGWSVAISGNVIVGGAFLTTVGVNQFQGAAFVYLRPKSGWKTTQTFNAELASSDGMTNDEFAASVGISGTTIVAGAPLATIGANLSQGAAYVFGK